MTDDYDDGDLGDRACRAGWACLGALPAWRWQARDSHDR